MKKRLISFLLIIAVMLSFINVSYANDEFLLLDKLGISIDYNDKETAITRVELCEIALNMLGIELLENGEAVFLDVPEKHKDFAIINTAYQYGIIKGYPDMTFRPDEIAYTNDVAGMILIILGYGPILNSVSDEKYTAIVQDIASSSDIYKGVSRGELTKYNFAKMLCNMLEAETIEAKYIGSGAEYEGSGKQYLNEKYGYYIVTGVLQAVGAASIMNVDPVLYGQVKVNGYTYDDGKIDMLDYIGRKVKLIVDEESNSVIFAKTLTTVEEDIEIDTKDIISYSNFKLEYYENDKTRSKTISQDSRIIVNGKNAQYDESLLKPISGTVKLIDGDGDGKCETVIVTSEVYIKVVAMSDSSITDLFTGKKISLDGSYDIACYHEGKLSGISEISKGSYVKVMADAISTDENGILWIDESKTEKITLRTIQGHEIEGSINAYSSDEITIEGTAYEFNPYIEYLFSVSLLNKPALGGKGKFYIDEKGDLLFFDVDSKFSLDSGKRYGYLLSVGLDDAGDRILVVLVNEMAEKVGLYSADKFYFNGKKTTYEGLKTCDGLNTDLFVNGTLRRQLVMYELNEEGEIRSLSTAKDYGNTNLLDSDNLATEYANPTYNEEGYKGYDEENFSLDFVDKTLFREGFNHLYQFNDQTIAFIVPKDPNQTQKYQIVSGNAKDTFTYDSSYSINLYNVTDEYYIGVALVNNSVVENSTVKTMNYNIYGGKHQSHIITKSSMMWDEEEGEARMQFQAQHFVYNGKGAIEDSVLVCDDPELTDTDTHYTAYPNIPFEKLEPGDIIHYYTDSDGKVERFRILLRISDAFNADGTANYKFVNKNVREGSLLGAISRVVQINDDGSLILSASATDEFTSMYYCEPGIEQIYLYDTLRKTGGKIELSDIEVGDTVFTRSESGRVREMFVYR